jgi:tRNA (guanine37-N1)-methyltransferase
LHRGPGTNPGAEAFVKVDVVTIVPGILRAALEESILGIAREKGALDVVLRDPREFTFDRHRSVDDRPYGGGPGMVMKAEPLVLCAEAARRERGPGRVVALTPAGRRFTQEVAKEYAGEDHLILLCGRYEGFDQRAVEALGAEELSVGDFVLSGGEPAALAVIDAVARLLPGVLGDADSTREESFEDGLLEYPQYTRPAEFRGLRVPVELLSGDHARIRAWRRARAEERTARQRTPTEDTTCGG